MADLGLGGNDTSSRIKHVGNKITSGQNVPAKHIFGTPEEIAARVGGTFPTHPANKPSNFRQLGPASPGGNINDLKPTTKSGPTKFGNPRGYA